MQLRIGLLAVLIVTATAFASDRRSPLQQPQQTNTNQQSLDRDNRGTEQTPLIVKTIPPDKSQDDIQREKEKAELDRKTVQFTGDLVSYTWLLFIATSVLALTTGGLGAVAFFQMRDTRKGIKAAEDAVVASLAALAHARETAERDFRPWLTLNAKLISPVDIDPIANIDSNDDERGIAFFIELQCRNVGKVAALNVIYSVSGIDMGPNEDADDWLQALIDDSIHACKFAAPQSWRPKHSLESSSDALSPSEEYTAKRWCQVPPLKTGSWWRRIPKERRIHRVYVGIVAAYRGVSSDEPIFYTAKVLPIGKINLPEFLGLIGETELPVGVGDVGVGPTYKAIAT